MSKEKNNIQFVPCVRCGYCCKKATCHVGLTHGAGSTNCMFLIGDEPGSYSCYLVVKKVYPMVERHLAIGNGCNSPLNSDRKVARGNIRMKELIL